MATKHEIIEILQKILSEEYGRDITAVEASEVLRTLVPYFDMLAKIYHREKVDSERNREEVDAPGIFRNERVSPENSGVIDPLTIPEAEVIGKSSGKIN